MVATDDNQQAYLAALYEVSAQLGATLDLTELLHLVMDSIIKLTGAERGFLMLRNEITGALEAAVARNVDQETIAGNAMQISRTIVTRAAESGQAILTDNAQEDHRFSAHQSVIGYQLRSIMCAPLRARGRIIGVAYVDNRLFSGVFSQRDLDLLVAFINQAAVAIDNARLFTQTDQALARRVEELTIFQQIDQELNRSLDLNRVLSLALDWAIKLTESDSGSIGLLVEEEEGSYVRLLPNPHKPDSPPRQVPASHPIVAELLQTENCVHRQHLSPVEAIDGTPAAAQLAVPIKREGRVIGLISLESQQSNTYKDEDIAFVTRLADRGAVAIENARLYEALQAADKAKTDFISVVTHELRLPMTSIKGYTDLVQKELVGPLTQQQKEFLEVVQRNVARMSVLIDDLSDINRIESKRMRFEFSQFDVRQVVKDVLATMRERLETKQQTVHLQLPADLPLVYADRTRINQVLTNLLSNANKYTPPQGEITIQATALASHVQLSVVDNGLGIAPEDQARLFTQFFRSADTQVREQPGWGLGLSIVKMIVEAQGGEINFQSVYRQGSTFTFTIPIASLPNAPQTSHL
ncbi:MAG: hypothetical protein Fur0021_31780 [Candidatus Promineifilaceae bacterium]